MLCSGRSFPTPDGKAHFAIVRPPQLGEAERDGELIIATRRGKQFNSMIQQERDPLTGAERNHIFVSIADAARLGLRRDDPVVVRNEHGEYRGRAFPAEVAVGTLQGHWPELLPLIPHGRVDPQGGVPDYNARVRIEKG